jgi:serine/threonine-protein kinase
MTAQPIPFDVAAPSTAIPAGLRGAVMRALAKDRDQRHTSAREFFDELSGGGRITVEGSPPPQQAGTGTAAMGAVPDFGRPATAASPMYAPRAGAPTPPAAVANIPHTVGGHRPAKGGGKGLLIGLGVLGAGLLATMAVIAARSMSSPEDEPTLTLGATTDTATPAASTAAPPATFAPLETPPPDPTPVPTPSETPTPPTATTKPTAGTGPKPPAAGGCDACLSAANSGNYPSAARAYSSCNDAVKKKDCQRAVGRGALGAAQEAARNGKCQQADAIIAAATAMGMGGRILAAKQNTSCK